MRTADFDYELPPSSIAQVPAEPRDSSRLMAIDRSSGRLDHRAFREIGEFLRQGDLLVLNNTRVIPARLCARKSITGGRVEILLLDQLDPRTWWALVGGRRVHDGTDLDLQDQAGESTGIRAKVVEQGSSGQRMIRFSQPSDEWLWGLGHMPLPPYIHDFTGDPERYQTVYAQPEGSAAAPTAGLHFTPDLLIGLRETGVRVATVTLRIGLDTFKPIDEDFIAAHTIHTEWAQLSPDVARQINETKLAGGRVVAVGTSTVRTLETAALKAHTASCTTSHCGWSTVSGFQGRTDLYITPGFRFRAVDCLLTNFHLPRSTLIVLVSAFAGLDAVKRAYATGIELGYRFYSFGDAMLII